MTEAAGQDEQVEHFMEAEAQHFFHERRFQGVNDAPDRVKQAAADEQR